MAATSATTVLSAAAVVGPSTRSPQRRTRVNHINGLNSFGGLKANNSVASLGLPVCTEHSFAKIVSSLKKPSQSRNGRGGGGALTSTCNAVGEIYTIAAIMPGLVLVGVAIGFVLLRIEAIVEEE